MHPPFWGVLGWVTVKPASWYKRKKHEWTCRSSTHSLQKAKRTYHGPKIGATNLEASSWATNLILWSYFWVQNLAPVLGPQNTNRSYPIRAARMLLPTQADSSTYPWYSEGTCPRSLLYYLSEAPVLGHWAHLGFEKKRPQYLNKRATAWGTDRNGLDAKLLWISRKTIKARVANHNGLDAKLLRRELQITAAGCTNVFALLVVVKVQTSEQHGHPCTFWNVLLVCPATWAHFWGCGPACFLPPSLHTWIGPNSEHFPFGGPSVYHICALGSKSQEAEITAMLGEADSELLDLVKEAGAFLATSFLWLWGNWGNLEANQASVIKCWIAWPSKSNL